MVRAIENADVVFGGVLEALVATKGPCSTTLVRFGRSEVSMSDRGLFIRRGEIIVG